MAHAAARRTLALHAVFLFSGLAGLGYQMAWTRMLATALGHEMPSVLAVVAALFGGLALGAWALDGVISRSPRPVLWYAGLETVIGLWGFVSIAIVPWLGARSSAWIGIEPSALRQWSLSFVIPLAALLPATMAMGATLPAMERAVSRLAGHTRCVGGLYAANTLGAVVGVALSAFMLVPTLGIRMTIVTLALINLACAVAALAVGGKVTGREGDGVNLRTARAPSLTPSPLHIPTPSVVWRLDITVFLTGLLGIGYEVLGVRVLSQVTQNTVYSFAGALIAYLLGTAIGATIYQRWPLRRAAERFEGMLTFLLLGLCTACLMGVIVMRWSLAIETSLANVMDESMASGVLREMLISALVFGLPTMFMGATFSHLVQAARRATGGVGRAAGLNTLGGAIAPAIFGVALLPMLGAKVTLTGLALAYLAIVPRFTARVLMWLAVPLLLAVLVLPADLRIVTIPEGGRLRDYRDGMMAAVAVVEDSNGGRFLRVNNRFQMGATIGTFAERRLCEIPLLLHPSPQRALFLGLGTGVSFGAAADHGLARGDGVELVPEVVDVMTDFAPENNSPQSQPNLRVFVADARRFVQATDEHYDVIVGDLFHPARDGAGSLYTIEHFRAVRERLAPSGLFCQWLPLYQLDDDMLRVIVRTFLEVFPHAWAFIGHYNVNTPALGLVGTMEPMQYPPDWFERRVTTPLLRQRLKEVAMDDAMRLFGCLLAGRDELARYADGAPLNTDDHPIVAFGAPRFAYHEPAGHGRLPAFIEHVSDGMDELISTDQPADEFRGRLRRFIAARNVYLHGMIDMVEGRPDEGLTACIESARISPDFTTGYAHGVQLAVQMAGANRPRAREALQELIAAQPDLANARDAMRQFFGE